LGNLTFQYNTWTDTTNFTVDGTSQPVNDFKTGVSYKNAWFTSTLRVKTVDQKRYAVVYHGSNFNCENQCLVTSWVPAGTYVTVGARTGAFNGEHYVNHVVLEYL
jgi:hypothetical protein